MAQHLTELNTKTIGGQSLLGEGDIPIGSGDISAIKLNGTELTPDEDKKVNIQAITTVKLNGNTVTPEDGEVDINISGSTVITDNLDSTSTNEALSANQGRVLNEKFALMPVIHVSKLHTLAEVIAEVPTENRALNMEVHFFDSEGIYKKYLYIPTDTLDRMFLLTTSWLDLDSKDFNYPVVWWEKNPVDFNRIEWGKTINTNNVIVTTADMNSGVTDFISITDRTAIATSWLFRYITYDEDKVQLSAAIMYQGITLNPNTSNVRYVRLQVSRNIQPSWKIASQAATSGASTPFKPYVEVKTDMYHNLVDYSTSVKSLDANQIPIDPSGVVTTKWTFLSNAVSCSLGETFSFINKDSKIIDKTSANPFNIAIYDELGNFINTTTSYGEYVVGSPTAKFIKFSGIAGAVPADGKIFIRGNVKQSRVSNSRLKLKRWLLVGDSITTEDGAYAQIGYGKNVGYINNTRNTNIAVSGHQTSATLTKINNTDCSVYDFATLLIGTNDFGYSIGISAFKSNLQAIIDKMRTDNPSIKIGLMTLLKRSDQTSNAIPLELPAYNTAIKEVAQANGLPVLDLYNECQLDPFNVTMKDLYYVNEDGLHPNDLGHELFITPLVNEFINKLV